MGKGPVGNAPPPSPRLSAVSPTAACDSRQFRPRQPATLSSFAHGSLQLSAVSPHSLEPCYAVRSAQGDFFLVSFTSSSIGADAGGSAMPSVDIKPGVRDAFRVLALSGVKAVSTAAPIVLSSGDGSSGGGSSGGGQSSGGGSGGSNSSRALRIPTTLKGIGEKSLLDYPTPEIRRTAAARMDENPRDARWFSGACYPHNTVQAGAPHSVALYSCSSMLLRCPDRLCREEDGREPAVAGCEGALGGLAWWRTLAVRGGGRGESE